MKKVLIIANHHVYVYNFRREIIQGMLDDGHKVFLALPYGEKVEELKKMGCEFIDTPDLERHGMNPFIDLKLLKNYYLIIKMIKPDIMYSYTIKPNIYAGFVCNLMNVPYVPNITGLGSAVEKESILQKIIVLMYKISFKKVKRVFCQNEDNMSFLYEKGIAKNKLKLLPGSGVNLKCFVPLEYPCTGTTEFAFISRIMKEKGIEQYLDMAVEIKRKYQNAIFHVCGFCEEEYEQKLKKLENDGIIIYHGMIKNVSEFLKDIQCVIHPTYYPEGISNVLLEASASARPIITTDRAGCREVIDDGVNGFIVKQKDSRDLTDKVEKFLKLSLEERKNMGIAGRLKVEKEFDRQIVVDAYIKELNTL